MENRRSLLLLDSIMSGLGFGGFGCSKKRVIRKTGETVEIIAEFHLEEGARADEDWVSYIDSEGNEHIKEHLNIQFDFKEEDDPWQKQMEKLLEQAKSIDQWEQRRYDLAKEFVMKGLAESARGAVAMADKLIEELKPSCPEPPGAVCAE